MPHRGNNHSKPRDVPASAHDSSRARQQVPPARRIHHVARQRHGLTSGCGAGRGVLAGRGLVECERGPADSMSRQNDDDPSGSQRPWSTVAPSARAFSVVASMSVADSSRTGAKAWRRHAARPSRPSSPASTSTYGPTRVLASSNFHRAARRRLWLCRDPAFHGCRRTGLPWLSPRRSGEAARTASYGVRSRPRRARRRARPPPARLGSSSPPPWLAPRARRPSRRRCSSRHRSGSAR